jgi:hypothetical protein
MPKSVHRLDIVACRADDRRMRIPGGTTAARLARRPLAGVALTGLALTGLALTGLAGCSGGDDPAAPTPSEVPSSVAAFPEEPHVTGRVRLTVQAALPLLTAETCVPEERRVCSVDGGEGWAPLQDPARATLVEARTHPADGHTSWTARLRFTPDSRDALRTAAGRAGASGGVVVVMENGRVVAAVPPSDLQGTTAVLADLDQPTAWGLVESFGAG